MTQWIRILELIGGAAFALSGAAAAMEHGLDIFGLLVPAMFWQRYLRQYNT